MATNSRDPRIAMASTERAQSFVFELQAQFAGKTRSASSKQAVREWIAAEGGGIENLQAIGRRILTDLVAPPHPPKTAGRPSARRLSER